MRGALLLLAAVLLAGCGAEQVREDNRQSPSAMAANAQSLVPPPDPAFQAPAAVDPLTQLEGITATPVATLAFPWAMTFMPDGRMLITERTGNLRLVTQAGVVSAPIAGVPAVAYPGDGGLLDVTLHPRFSGNKLVYLSFVERSGDVEGMAIALGHLAPDGAGVRFDRMSVIWRQYPKLKGAGHFGGRMAFTPDLMLFMTTGERQRGPLAQNKGTTAGKIIRLNANGTIPADNPFAADPRVKKEIWSLGHRNPYGLAFASDGRLWQHEMGPFGGDEFNLIERGLNYGWPNVSNGDTTTNDIPDHSPGDGYAAPAISWTPVIAPAGMIFYSGSKFPAWRGDALITGLVSQGLLRIRITGTSATEIERIPLGKRIREVEQGPDGSVWVLEDGPQGRLIKLTPA